MAARPIIDGAVTSFVFEKGLGASGVGHTIDTWGFYARGDTTGKSVTPLLLERSSGNTYFIRAISQTRTIGSGGIIAGLNDNLPFDTQAGSPDITSSNYYIGWKDGTQTSANSGVISWDGSESGDFFSALSGNSSRSITAGDIGTTLTFGNTNLGNRRYSVKATAVATDNVVCDPLSDHCYELVSESMDWFEAKAAADGQTYNGMSRHLVTLTSAQETTFLTGNISGITNQWIGAYQPTPGGLDEPAGGWAWVTGEGWSYTNWASGEPNNCCGGIEHYGHFWGAAGSGEWNDIWYYWPAPSYVIEYEEEDTPPTLSLPADITGEEATGPGGAAVSYSATASDTEDGTLTPTCNPASGATFAIGTTTVNCSVTDSGNNTVNGSFDVTVEDTTDPDISNLSADTGELWVPNDKMPPVTVSVTASDSVDPNPSCVVTGVSDNETDEADDWEITGDLTVDLRAQRDGGGNGQTYTISITCTDGEGNSADDSVDVTVAHDQGRGKANGRNK